MNVKNRTLFCHDNLEVLQGMNSEMVDLIYLDPPFNKNKKFTHVISTDKGKKEIGFIDIFRQKHVKDEWLESIKQDYEGLYQFLTGVRNISNIVSDRKNNHYLYNYCYLVYMAMRLLEMRRILKNTGSLYLHCDPKMSHYLKILLDIIFGEKNFRNEIIWAYSGGGIPRKDFPRKHDTIFRYVKNEASDYCFNIERKPYKKNTQLVGKHSTLSGGKKIDLKRGTPITDTWADLKTVTGWSVEKVGWETQKPISLLERIIKASSKKGDMVLDPFCGCATTCIAAEKLGRKWIGIDKDAEAYYLVKQRAKKEIPTDLFEIKDITSATKPPKRTDLGKDYRLKKYVYVISHPTTKFFKVGIAKDIKSRLSSYQTACPDRKYKLEHCLLTPYFQEIEKYIHGKYKTNLLGQEWVNCDLEKLKGEIEKFKK